MIGTLYVIIEAFAVVVCLNALYGEKFRMNMNTILFLILDCIIMSIIRIYELNQLFSLIVYFLIILYCCFEFGYNLKQIFANVVLTVLIIACLQLFVSIIFSSIYYLDDINKSLEVLFINSIVLLIMIGIYRFINLHKLSLYFQRKEILLAITLILECIVVFYLLFHYKNANGMLPEKYIVLMGLLVFIVILCINALLYKIKYQEKKSELEVYKTYSAVFEELITEIRTKQHEFDNHINALCNLHYVCKDYDKLVLEQSKYAKDVIHDNKFNKLLTSGNPVLSGFLYGRLRSIESMGIHVSYKVCVSDFQCRIPIYLIIEMIGNFLNNAVEALERESEERQLYVECIEEEKTIRIIVQNTSRKISYDEMAKFFEKGYSSKGIKRGLGLYHVKKICDDYHINILCENKEMNGINWMAFELHIKK